MAQGYKAKVRTASKEFDPKEKIVLALRMGDAIKLDEAVTPDEGIVITPAFFATVDVHNEKSDNKDYVVYLLEDTDGTLFSTSSNSLIEEVQNIVEQMDDAGAEIGTYDIKIIKKESKNYKNKYFITATLA